MDEPIDAAIRVAVRSALDDFPAPGPEELAEAVRLRSTARKHRLRGPLAAAGIAASVLLVVGLLSFQRGTPSELMATERDAQLPPAPPAVVTALPGEGLPALVEVTAAGHDGTVFLAGSSPVSETGEPSARAFILTRGSERWAELPPPPLDRFDLVAAGDRLVILGAADDSLDPSAVYWSVLNSQVGDWSQPSSLPPSGASEMRTEQLRLNGLTTSFESAQLVWTGTHVIDTKYGIALDPAAGDVKPLASPSDVAAFRHLASAVPVWTGSHVVLVRWGSGAGLAWTGDGQGVRVVPGMPSAMERDDVLTTTAASVQGAVVLSSRVPDGNPLFATLDPGLTAWQTFPAPPSAIQATCGWSLFTVDNRIVGLGCSHGGGSQTQIDNAWITDATSWYDLGPLPAPIACCTNLTGAATEDGVLLVDNSGAVPAVLLIGSSRQ